MQVFKLYFKIVNRYKFNIFLTMGIAFAFAVIFANNGGNEFDLSSKSANVVIIDNDSSESSKGLISYLDEKTRLVDIDEKEIEQALYYGKLDYVLYIPSGYEQSIINNNSIVLKNTSSDKTNKTYVVNNHIEKYSNTLRNYVNYFDKSISSSVTNTINDLNVDLSYEKMSDNNNGNATSYFNFLFYTMLATILSGIALVMIKLNESDIKKRNHTSPISNFSFNLQLVIATIVFNLLVISIAVTFAFFFYNDVLETKEFYLHTLNLIVLSIPVVGLSYLCVQSIKKPEALSGISNVVSLGLSFIGGVFVPLEILGDKIVMVAKITPTYWYVQTNIMIENLNDVSSLRPLYNNMFIMAIFGVIYFIFALLIGKIRSKNVI